MNDVKIKSYYKNNYLRPWIDTNHTKIIVRESGCFPVKLNDTILIVTTNHTITQSNKTDIITKKSKYISNRHNVASNYDLVFLSSDYSEEYYTMNSFDLEIPEKGTTLYSYDRKELIFKEVVFENSLHPLYPQKIFFNMIFKDDATDDSFKGYSGTLVFKNNKIVGMITHLYNGVVGIIPSKVIIKFLENYDNINTNYIIGLNRLYMDLEIDNFKRNGFMIDTKQKNINIPNESLILSIYYNNIELKINEKGFILDIDFKYWIPLNIYIHLNSIKTGNIKALCAIKKTSGYEILKRNIKIAPLENYLNILESSEVKIRVIDNKWFVEASLNYINNLDMVSSNGSNIYDKIIKLIKYKNPSPGKFILFNPVDLTKRINIIKSIKGKREVTIDNITTGSEIYIIDENEKKKLIKM